MTVYEKFAKTKPMLLRVRPAELAEIFHYIALKSRAQFLQEKQDFTYNTED